MAHDAAVAPTTTRRRTVEEVEAWAIAEYEQHLIRRPRLLELLDDPDARIVLLIAPAGYGKTILLRQWLTDHPENAALVTARPAWHDPAVIAADIATFLPAEAVARTSALLASTTPVEEDTLIAVLADEVAKSHLAVLAVDDLHLAEGGSINRVLAELAARLRGRIVIATRLKPEWVTVRDVAYRTVLEVTRDELAFSTDEMRAATRRDEVDSWMERTHGWPALARMLSMAPQTTEGEPPAAVHDYLVGELLSRSSPSLRADVRVLACLSSWDRKTAVAVFGRRYERILEEATARGFLERVGSSRWRVNPLVAEVVVGLPLTKAVSSRISKAAGTLITRGSWDSAFELIDHLKDGGLLTRLVSTSLADLVGSGRFASLETWTRRATEWNEDSAAIDLAQSELSLWSGESDKALYYAQRCADRSVDEPMTARAHFVAGRAHYLMSQYPEALRHLELAEGEDASLLDEIFWFAFLTRYEAGRGDPSAVLERLRSLATTAKAESRVAVGAAILETRRGKIDEAISILEQAAYLEDRITEPTARSALMLRLAYSLALAARYDEAWQQANRVEGYLRSLGLLFALPHVTAVLAASATGLRRFGDAEALVAAVSRSTGARSDPSLAATGLTLQLRHFLSTGDVAATMDFPTRLSAPEWITDEYMATRAIASAVVGDVETARKLLSQLRQPWSSREAAGARICALTLVAIKSRRGERQALDALAHDLATTGYLDSFVTTYRAYPQLLTRLAAIGHGAFVSQIAHRAHDHDLCRAQGLERTSAEDTYGLTPRERQVLALLGAGLTNRAIGEALYITEATAKLHVRRIMRKLGTRNRTEAALFIAGVLQSSDQ